MNGMFTHVGRDMLVHVKTTLTSELRWTVRAGVFLMLSEICSDIASKGYASVVLRAGKNNFGNLIALDLNGCENLTELYLNFNQISIVEQDTFHDFHQLVTLDISRNLLPVYSGKWNASFLPSTLKMLKLHGCQNQVLLNASVPDFDDQKNLSSLPMDGYPNISFNFSKITHLSLSGLNIQCYCNLSRIDNNTFSHLRYRLQFSTYPRVES
ncbi:hypothetical protein DPMN_070511 [Dreissena polymorpha]|uniref:Toll-like receptor 5 n=1 Tax=Dreissena polymorpha TaxID=45954 RepID=A0A9D3Z629_DREPO|nr:hypothetical protein DPMN_070511 [Dreissena polymorpha]